MLGAPGTGKGTLSGVLAEKFNIPQVSTGDIFREHIANKTELGQLVEGYMNKGLLVPDDVTVRLIEDRLSKTDAENGVILDGFPRTVSQAEDLEKLLAQSGKKVDLTINLTASEEQILTRIVNRRICSNQSCKSIYNTLLKPSKQEGICDKCGFKLVARNDDKPETVKDRLNTYINQTSPLVDYYKQKGNLYVVETTDVSIEELKEEVINEINSRVEGK
jgi:adenylate kinase